ncbi:glycosyltransferase [Luethyella okanaganae]|uniref:Glycosyltransferase n=1 Tax=Luethyella okanaganae TaxID=69372 RepID=A0ABW1VC17_9MICO
MSERDAEVVDDTIVDVTVIVPTFNGADHLDDVLHALARQEFPGTVEILVIDSGSTDGTVEIVRSHPTVRLHEIPNVEFGHGRTRNLAARLARGRLLAYLTQDAIPADQNWLRELTAPLEPDGDDAVAVVGKQIPRAGCFPLAKYEIQGVFARLGPEGRTTVVQKNDADGPDTFYSDVNSATRRDFLLETIPYRDVPYSEDLAFGADVVAAGYRKAYAPGGAVIHSNDLTLREYGARIFDEVVGMRRVGERTAAFGLLKMFAHIGYGVLGDSVRIVRDPDYGVAHTIGWLLRNPAYHVARWVSYRRANRVDLSDVAAIERGSLEHARTRTARS